MQIFKDEIGKLSYLIDPNHKQDWFIKELFPLMCTLQQKIDMLQDALKKENHIEAMVWYPHEYWGREAPHDPSILCIQNQIVNITENLKDMQPTRLTWPNVWCTTCLVGCHIATEWSMLWDANTTSTLVGPPGSTPVVGVVKIGSQGLYIGCNQF